jgi:SAM-dependent methyltransferase
VTDPRETFACPVCRGVFSGSGGSFECTGCGRHFTVEDGIPVLLAEGDSQRGAQMKYFDDEVDEEFEIERPTGTPRLYEAILREKFRLATRSVELRGAQVLVICGGSGMDAEFLAEAGANVVSSDVSLGAGRRARERAQRHGVDFSVVVADAEHLPFRDGSFDVVYVHDGLHHIDRPLVGLAEMARVARGTVCLTEPARSVATKFAVKLGLAQNVEDAGNRVARLTAEEVVDILGRDGFQVVSARRYAMFYRHEPKLPTRALSLRLLAPVVIAGLRVASAAAGPVGNKLVVTAVRT